MTVSPHTERDLTLPQIQKLIKLGTARELVFEYEPLKIKYDALFKLVRMPDPIGYLLVANQDIRANQSLFPYGGESIDSQLLPEMEQSASSSKYLLKSDVESKNTLVQQAELEGDLGALAAHLPDADFLRVIGLKSNHSEIQTANAQVRYDYIYGKKRLFLCSTEAIKKGSVIGYNYGWEYWVERKISPVFFANNSLEVLDTSGLDFDGAAVCCDIDGNPYLRNPHNPTAKTHVLVTPHFLADEARSLSTPIVSSEKAEVVVAFDGEEVKRVIRENTNTRGRLTNVFLFFRSEPVAGCAPPPGSIIRDQKTIAPGNR